MALEVENKDSLYEDCVSHAKEAIIVIANEKSSVTSVEELKELWERINALKQKANEKVKNDISGLQNLLDEWDNPEMISELTEKEKSLMERCQEANKRLTKVNQECKQMKEEVKSEEKEYEKHKTALLDVNKNKTYSLPKSKYNVNIYCNISNIRWQLNASPDEIKGYVSKKKDVQPFSLDKKQHSNFFITNYLWDLMEEDW